MSNLRRVLEKQQKEREEIRRRRADEDRDADEEEEQMLAAAVCMLNQSRQHRRRAPNMDRRRESRVENLYTREYLCKPTPRDLQRLLKKGDDRGFPGMIGSIDCMHWQWKNCPTAWQGEYGNRKGQKMFDEVLRGHSPQVTYQINNTVYSGAYYLADGIYPRWTTFVKTISNPQSEKERNFASFQEGYRKDVERCFGILQARWAIIRGAARMLDEEVLRSIMMTCIILHNMIVEDEYDYDAPKVFEPDPMNTALTRIYERPMGPNGIPMEPEPLLRDGQFNNPMIDRYQEMQSSYVHERRQVDLIEYLWERKGNHNG
ncbi:hypothetical protein ACE6H2_007569 [Prunus campanulata]